MEPTDDQILWAMKTIAAREKGITATALYACVRDLLAPSKTRMHHILWDAIANEDLILTSDSRLIKGVVE